MKIKVFTLNENGKIELTKEELQQLLDETASSANVNWQSPNMTNLPYNTKSLEIYYDGLNPKDWDYTKVTRTNSEVIK